MLTDIKDKKHTDKVRSELSHLANTYYSNYKPTKNTIKKHKILNKLKSNTDIVITRPDKGSGVVILDKNVYNNSIKTMLSDTSKFRKLQKDPTLLREGQLQRRLLKAKKKGFFTDTEYAKVYPSGSRPARSYGLPKTHKVFVNHPSFRLIVSSIGTFNYKLASHLGELVKEVTPNNYNAQDTFEFLKDLKQINIDNNFTVSFDVCSLFTNIPLNETIDIAVNLIFDKKPDLKISKKELKDLFEFCTSKTNFLFNGVIYDQIDGCAMGSPLAPPLANLFMGINETKWLEEYHGTGPIFYKRYVDDIFAVFENELQSNSFFDYLNNRHPNITFTKENNENGQLPFLDILISNSSTFSTTIYRKTTYTGLLLNFKSFTPFQYKTRLIQTLLDRTYKICSSWVIFDKETRILSKNLLRNMYPKRLLEKCIKKYLDKRFEKLSHENKDCENNENKDIKYITLPYLGYFSNYAKKRIKNLVKQFCDNKLNIQLVFTTCKLKSYFSNKDRLPMEFTSRVIYKFKCAGCNASYVGRTHCHFDTRCEQHLKTDSNSHILKHIKIKNECKKSDKTSFKIIDRANSDYALAIKEGMHIKWQEPTLNTQKKHVILKLLV